MFTHNRGGDLMKIIVFVATKFCYIPQGAGSGGSRGAVRRHPIIYLAQPGQPVQLEMTGPVRASGYVFASL